jgi:hypothetical protein
VCNVRICSVLRFITIWISGHIIQI